MGIQCRAKDPSSCRVHGTSGTYERLQGIADRAALSGNTSLYLDMRAQMDALSDEVDTVSNEAVEAVALSRWSGGRWEKMAKGMKMLYRANARKALEAAAPHLQNGSVTGAAVNAYAKTDWESRETAGKWALATVEDRKVYRANARKALEAAYPHMREPLNEEDFDLEKHLAERHGLNVIYRRRMKAILKSEDNEIPRLKELYEQIKRRQDEEGVRLMSPEFEKEFITIFNNNARPEHQIK
jgi:hypothetical protein